MISSSQLSLKKTDMDDPTMGQPANVKLNKSTCIEIVHFIATNNRLNNLFIDIYGSLG